MKHFSSLYLFLLLFFSLHSYAQNNKAQEAVDNFCQLATMKSANISILIYDQTANKTIAAHRPEHSVPTASTMKVITTATALEYLTPDFCFPTYLLTDGKITGSTLEGNLYIYGTGDPTLGSEYLGNKNFLSQWVNALKQLGIKRIKGRVIADASFYDPAESIPYNWIYEDLGNYYAPGIYPLPYFDNTMTIFLKSGPVGTEASVVGLSPEIADITFENYMTCGVGRDWFVNGLPYNNHRVLSGCITPNKGRWSVKAAIPNPPLLLAQDLTKQCIRNGISIDSAATYIKTVSNQQRDTLYTYRSVPLKDIIAHTNQESDNMYAEQIFRYLGTLVGTPVLIANCSEMEKMFWHNHAVNLHSAFIFDGSGLSPQDAVSAKSFVEILRYMATKSKFRNEWIASLPVSGQSGTLKGFLADTKLEGKVIAKSGTTSRVKSYAGYVNAPDGHQYVFAILVNNATTKSRNVRKDIEKLLKDIFID